GLDRPDPNFRGITNSIAVKFDVFNNSGEGINSTGLFTGGRSPTVREPGLAASFPDQTVNLDGTGIDLNSGHVFRITLEYDGTTLTQMIRDTGTHTQFRTSYVVNIPAFVGGSLAFVGFTGATGGLSAVQDIQTWEYQFDPPSQQPGSGSEGDGGSAGAAAPP